ncbi:heterocyst frequency control protein PatD [cf. Phormidesmis sp. LEGE 11477]|uniref:heterocyst frequency control protein PatD n=1 Tax=cf. Phormidesmis sp. LEGE 11477 TaxID=1828680 RepID=UPI001880243F|nr:heterocyst frequency control protein PatD [cf. Phormidesmis sp. LEGE 11477]MBE9061675.1 heterocyst frequency control protein PatD [cf. Phormidesmis sp. LEGE 11477]
MQYLGDQLAEWVRSLSQLQQLVLDEDENTAIILQQTAVMQPQFRAIIAAIEAAALSPAVEQSLRPYQTEAHRRLRLMSVEGMKLRTARSPETLAQVRSQLKAHLDQLQQFAIAMTNELG